MFGFPHIFVLFCCTPWRPKGGSYMLPFWNHILANLGLFSHVPSRIPWYVCCMYLGTKGVIFQTCVFCDLPPCCFVGHFPLCVPILILRFFLGMTACSCVLAVTSAPHHHVPSAITTGRLRLFSFQPNTWLHISNSLHPKPPSPPLNSYIRHG